jgi:hypothetical protein
MKVALEKFENYLDSQITYRARILLAFLTIPLFASFLAPLWNITMFAPQYPEGLSIDIYSYQIEGGHGGHDIQEINTLNHYIGMSPLDEVLLSDLNWIPFVFLFMAIIALRAAAIGNIRTLIDLAVINGFLSCLLMYRFIFHLYTLGHTLDPKAPMNVEPFLPAIFGTKQIANFTVTSMPRLGSLCVLLGVGGVMAITFWHLYTGYKNSKTKKPSS